ncbi:MAG: HEPN domain-containing protein [Prevotellaceae bacterium]|jgi:hypothetical protein|nr:HEPN domain-containing protein [Prevotellaceae bacterium]
MEKHFDVNTYVAHWVASADDDYQAMTDMFATRHYHWALFMGHLVVEKLLKAFYVQAKAELPPLICTKEFATEWIKNITTIQQWIKTTLLK